MQNIKDSFYVTLRDRLAALNPVRTVTVLGVTRPAVIVAENEIADSAVPLPEAFYLAWGAASAAAGTERLDLPLLKLTCEITYWTQGSDDLSSQDRGRTLAKLDEDLLAITTPSRAALKDFSQAPVADLAANIFWSSPVFGASKQDGNKLSRNATIEVFSHMEAAQ